MAWSSVDRSAEPDRFIDYLDAHAVGLAAMKHYSVATHARFHHRLILDLGCGAGHDLALLDSAGLAPLGVDPSATMLTACRARGVAAPLVRAAGESLPLRDASIAGCKIERVLQHVPQPARVLAEVARLALAAYGAPAGQAPLVASGLGESDSGRLVPRARTGYDRQDGRVGSNVRLARVGARPLPLRRVADRRDVQTAARADASSGRHLLGRVGR